MEYTQILAIARDWVAIISLPIIAYRVWILKSSFSQDHERSRNEKAVDLINDWTKMLNQKSSAARKIVEQLSKQECIELVNQQRVTIKNNTENENLLKILFEDKFNDLSKNDGEFNLDVVKSSQLRWEVITYLNVLESILTAYRHNVADKEIIKEQILYLVNPKENHFVLEEFRDATGVNNYPGIKNFVDEIKKENQSKNPGKAKTGTLINTL